MATTSKLKEVQKVHAQQWAKNEQLTLREKTAEGKNKL